jgi:hypothetical protein
LWFSLGVCSARRVFLHIVNRVVLESSGRVFVSVVDYIKVRFARAEDELGF